MPIGTLWHATLRAAQDWWNDNCLRLAASLAYYTALSLAPLVLLIVGVIGLVLDPREQGDAGDYAATGISSTSRSMSGYQRLKMTPSSPFSVRTRVCNNEWAPSLDHCICCFLQNRLLTTSLTVDSTKPVAIASPW